MNTPHPDSAIIHIGAGLDLVLISDDEILVQFGTRSHPSELLRDTDMTGVLGRAVGRLLQGPASVGELRTSVGDSRLKAFDELLSNLLERGILVHSDQDPVDQYVQYSMGEESRLGSKTVAVFGCGPLGVRIAANLLSHGVGSLIVADPRPVDQLWERFLPSGFAQPDSLWSTAGEAAHRVLSRGRDNLRCGPKQLDADSIGQTVLTVDLAVLATEQVDLRLAHLVNRSALLLRKPWLHCVIDGNVGIVGPLFNPPYTACYNDFRTLSAAATPSPDMMNRYRRHMLDRPVSSFFPGLPAYADIVAGHAALAAVGQLLGRHPFVDRVMLIDFERMLVDTEDVLRLPRCPVCATERTPARPVVPAFSAS
jgi:bacteriocin biosynthesis cyclodehydratase domain-containing protein